MNRPAPGHELCGQRIMNKETCQSFQKQCWEGQKEKRKRESYS